LTNDSGQPASGLLSEEAYKNDTFEDKTRNNHQYT